MSTFPPTPASNSNTTTNNNQNPAPQITQMTLPSPSLSQSLSIKLDETNLLLWKSQLLNEIIANGLEDFIDPDQSSPPKYLDAACPQVNPEFVQWDRLNRLVMSWIYSSLTPGMVGQIVEYSTARDIWASLNDEYESPSIATVMSLNSQLQRIKKIDIPLSEYLSRLKFVFDKFATIGEPLSYKDKLTRILEGLPEEYENFVSSIHNRSDRPSLQEVHSLLHTYEYRLSQRSMDQNLNFPQANVTTYLGNKKNQKNHYQNYPKQPQMPNSFSYIKPPYNHSLHPRPNSFPGLLGKHPNTTSFFQPRQPGYNNSIPQCQICGKSGHIALNGYHRTNLTYHPPVFPNAAAFNPNGPGQTSSPISAMLTTSAAPTGLSSQSSDNSWYMDSGATHHFTPEFGHMTDAMQYSSGDHALVGNDKQIGISHIGHALLHSSVKPIHLNHVLHTPEISKQLISVTRLCADNKAFVEFYPTFFLVKDQQTKQLLLQGHLERGLYKLAQPTTLTSSSVSSSPSTQFFPAPPAQAFLSQQNQVVLWHNRLGHPAPKVVHQVLQSCNLKFSNSEHICSSCQLAKSHRFPFVLSESRAMKPFDLVYSDLWGPSPIASVTGVKYFLLFIDNHTRFT